MRFLPVWRPVRTLLHRSLGFIYPDVCQFCGEEAATAAAGYVGANCRDRVRPIEPPFCQSCGLPFPGDITGPFDCANCRGQELHFESARSAVVARDVMLEAIHRYKYSQALWLEPFLAEQFLRAALPDLRVADADVLVPVPLHPLREREREFNQAERLARMLARASGIPVVTGRLRRIAATGTQTRLTREERAENMRGAFAGDGAEALRGMRVVLIDDVFTTGATTSACARILARHGARSVRVWTLARGV